MSWIVENRWRCTACQSENLGRHVHCQSCGKAKEEAEAKSETIDPNAVVTDAKLIAQAHEGPHWTCGYCGSIERHPDGHCASCGAGKSTASPLANVRYNPLEVDDTPCPIPLAPRGPGTGVVDPEISRRNPSRHQAAEHAIAILQTSDLRAKKALWISIPVALLVALVVWAFIPHEGAARVSSVKWIHIGTYEERRIESENGWGRPLFGSPFNVSCTSRIHGYHNCNPHDCNPHTVWRDCRPHNCNCHKVCKNLKNGFSSCDNSCSTCYDRCSSREFDTCYEQCPTYDDWCSWNYYRWVRRGEKTLSGDSAQSMMWPDLGPIDETHRLVQTPAYIVNFVDDSGQTMSYAPDTADEFSKFEDGQRWKTSSSRVGFFRPLSRL